MSDQHHLPRMERSTYDQFAPDVSRALYALGKTVDESGLEKSLTELIKLRASQLNGCAFCLRHHLNLAHQLEMDQAKIDMLAVWRESNQYSERERAALAWTEALTLIASAPASDSVYAQLQTQFSESEIAFLTASICTINFWNRLGGGLRFASSPVMGRKATGVAQ